MTQSEKVKAVTKILKKQFPHLDISKAIHIAYVVIEKLDGYPPEAEERLKEAENHLKDYPNE